MLTWILPLLSNSFWVCNTETQNLENNLKCYGDAEEVCQISGEEVSVLHGFFYRKLNQESYGFF